MPARGCRLESGYGESFGEGIVQVVTDAHAPVECHRGIDGEQGVNVGRDRDTRRVLGCFAHIWRNRER